MKTSSATFLVFAASLLFASGYAAPKEKTWEYQVLEQTIAAIGASVKASGSTDLKNAWKAVDIEVKETTEINAYFSRIPGRRPKIVLTTGLYLELLYLTELNIIVNERPELQEAQRAYHQYIYELNAKNQTSQLRKQPPTTLLAPEEYGKINSECAEFVACYPFPENKKAQRAVEAGAVVTFTLLHEFGHFWLGHQGIDQRRFEKATDDIERKEIFTEDMRRAREQEAEADQWATRQLMLAGNHPFTIITSTLMEMFIANTGIDAIFEKTQTHPVAVTRIGAIVAEIKAADAEIYHRDTPPAQVLAMLNDIQALMEKSLSLLPPAEIP